MPKLTNEELEFERKEDIDIFADIERLLSREKELHQSKKERYGDAYEQHIRLGKMITGLLESHYQISLPHDIPPHIVLLMMVCIKINRASLETSGSAEDFLDARIYMRLAFESRQLRENKKEKENE